MRIVIGSVIAGIALLAIADATVVAQTPKAGASSKVVVAKNTPIVVQTYNEVNSATFHSGERLAYIVTQDVIVNGALIARAGDAADGTVLDAQQGKQRHAGAAGAAAGPIGMVAGGTVNKYASQGADLRVSVTSVRTFCGGTIPLSFVRSEYHPPKRHGKAETVQIAKGQKYVATVAADTTACAVPTTRTPAPIPGDALHADSSSP
jgi:hypothetical protein